MEGIRKKGREEEMGVLGSEYCKGEEEEDWEEEGRRGWENIRRGRRIEEYSIIYNNSNV